MIAKIKKQIAFETVIAICSAAFLVAACQLLNVATFNDKMGAYYETSATVRQELLALGQAGKITKADAKNVQEQLNAAGAAVDAAREIYKSDTVGGNNKLQNAMGLLQAINTYLLTLNPPKVTT